jgi:hypothetical protein
MEINAVATTSQKNVEALMHNSPKSSSATRRTNKAEGEQGKSAEQVYSDA